MCICVCVVSQTRYHKKANRIKRQIYRKQKDLEKKTQTLRNKDKRSKRVKQAKYRRRIRRNLVKQNNFEAELYRQKRTSIDF